MTFRQMDGIAVAKHGGMYPLLVNALASTASNLIGRWAQSHASKAAAATVPFQQMLEGASSVKPAAAAAIEKLRGELLAAPELRTALDSADPAHPVTIQLLPDGTLTSHTAGNSPQILAVSPETAAAARTLAAHLSPAKAAVSLYPIPAL